MVLAPGGTGLSLSLLPALLAPTHITGLGTPKTIAECLLTQEYNRILRPIQ